METYRHPWNVYILNCGESTGFYTFLWSDTREGAERRARGMYPNATIIDATKAD